MTGHTFPNRRSVLKTAAAVAGTLAFPGRLSGYASGDSKLALPDIQLGAYRVSRLILGSNPFNGYCYSLPSLSEHMREWSTPENVCKTLTRAEQVGINTWQFSYHERAMADLRRFKSEGGTLQWLLLGGGELKENFDLIPDVAKLGPIGIVHHGGVTDSRFRRGEMARVHDFLKRVRDTGVLVGLSTHLPQVIEYVEERGWDVDFYMTCFYQLTRTEEETRSLLGEMPLGYVFLEKDPDRMTKMIRQTEKPCLAFKILAAGRRAERREELEAAFRFAFAKIKPEDAVIVGMYPRFKDEMGENAAIVRSILEEMS